MMAFVETRTQFPDFQTSKDFFKSGLGSPPEVKITGGAGGAAVQSPGVSPPGQGVSPPATQDWAPPPSSSGTLAPTVQPINLGYQAGGTAESKLFQPVGQGVQAGEKQLTEFADMFRTEAGPSRTYESIGAQGTLAGAVQGGNLQPAKDLVGASYQGPGGLDPNAAGNLMSLAGRLRAREEALGTGGGVSTILQQSSPGLTGGEARYTAQDLMTPEYRAKLQQATAGIDPFAERLESEILGTQEFARQRGEEEALIAEKSQQYLTGRGTGITDAIAAQMAEAQGQQQEATDYWQQIQAGEGPSDIATALREAQAGGVLDPSVDPEAFNTELQQALAAAPEEKQAILDQEKYAELKDVPIGEIGVDKKGRQTYLLPDANGNLVDFRQVLGKTAKGVLFKERQGELEEAFSPARGVGFPGGATSGEKWGEQSVGQLASPMYFGEDIDLPQVKEFLEFDPGTRPSRGNVSTEEQQTHYNRIQEILGNLDRIATDASPFKAAVIMASVDEYLAAEEEALTSQTGQLDAQAKQWFQQVKKARKAVRKAEREEDYGKIGMVVGGVLGGIVGTVVAPGAGTAIGAGIGTQLGEGIGTSLA